MHLINLDSSSYYKLKPAIDKLGGRYGLKESLLTKGVGVSGLEYYSGYDEMDAFKVKGKTIRVTLEKYKNGVGLYMRNIDINFALLIGIDELESIVIEKQVDLINRDAGGLYKILRKLGIGFLTARIFLLETDKVNYPPLLLQFKTKDNQEIHFEIETIRPNKVIEFINRIENVRIVNNIMGYQEV